MFNWIKQYMPSGLHGRAALILVLPVILIWLVVSIVFVQRHFEGVTEQMTQTIRSEIVLIKERLSARDNALEKAQVVAKPLGIQIRKVANSDDFFKIERRFYDFTGIVVRRELMSLADVKAVSLPDDGTVRIRLLVGDQFFDLTFFRDRVSASNPHQLIVNMIFFGGIFTIIAYIYLRNQLRPITRLASAAEAFGLGRTVAYKPSGAVEVRAAGQAFLDMRARIERHIEQRTMILSGVSHDLRTPLTRLKLGLSLLSKEEREPLERDVDEMRQLLDEFLSFARNQSEVAAKSAPTDPIALVKTIVDDAKRAGRNVRFVGVDIQDFVSMRPLLVKRALENLVMNAVRYGSKAEISVRFETAELIFSIADDGPGIPDHQINQALKPFSRLDPSRNQDHGSGVGLGLPIAADVARSHGGKLILSKSDVLGGLLAEFIISR
jgi:two-component system osmolarity sensor histidine kinase EnvZ